ncbi:MAG TPA: serine/threonine-protein kinase, partial [bacterium]|nr:serine/threonine-protein kinase [bacterium]
MESPPLAAGGRIGHYELVREAGRGGMGIVWLARDTRLDRQVAIKLLPADAATSGRRSVRFLREARALASLSHPEIVAVHALEEQADQRFIVMEWIDGRTLAEVIPRRGFGLGEFLALAIPVAAALEAAHERSVVHRDLKPGNIMVTADGRLKVMDFGLARLMPGFAESDEDPEAATVERSDPTEEGQVLGTAAYMSPEQVEGRAVDHRSDIFSLGVVFYEMLTGRSPFRGGSR